MAIEAPGRNSQNMKLVLVNQMNWMKTIPKVGGIDIYLGDFSGDVIVEH